MDEISVMSQSIDFEDIVAIVATAVVVCLYLYLAYRHRRERQLTLRTAIERGLELTPERLLAMDLGMRGPSADLRAAVICIALGVGFVAVGLFNPNPDVLSRLAGGAALMGIIGVAFLILWRMGNGRQR